jgi:hypothetical protein
LRLAVAVTQLTRLEWTLLAIFLMPMVLAGFLVAFA